MGKFFVFVRWMKYGRVDGARLAEEDVGVIDVVVGDGITDDWDMGDSEGSDGVAKEGGGMAWARCSEVWPARCECL